MKQLINKLVGAAYRRVFNREMSATEGDFVQSLAWVGAGAFIGTGLIAVFSILPGRPRGPAGHGKSTLSHAIAMFLSIPMIKCKVKQGDASLQRNAIATTHMIDTRYTSVSTVVMLARSGSLVGRRTGSIFRIQQLRQQHTIRKPAHSNAAHTPHSLTQSPVLDYRRNV